MAHHLPAQNIILITYGTLQVLIGLASLWQQWHHCRVNVMGMRGRGNLIQNFGSRMSLRLKGANWINMNCNRLQRALFKLQWKHPTTWHP
ncbi:hypothetical protein P152DRAFT_462409 [Eremomyces bilateralis CBS 781.70]|uniref:Uncharacterized protein n=1 Tax=Eremomyces bilateralis CBS 781.70 TaxID=1392243 RepID=A0A6G1FS46_9PEZI|nr:uncharacterized protein P152DRAFT_462409 [Eremomyces bilateralis CBS 781.70]KAF1808540.1 hypothetical protein P152DRAFT_462409 [Eremomyces bilateralis CBS 781.70]